MLRRLNKVLPELLMGILIYGVIVQITGVWFVADKIRYSSGLWIGIGTAMGMAIHMAVVIEDSVSLMIEKKARAKATVHSLIRYFAVVIIFLLMMYFHLGNLVTGFIGVFGLKAAAYMQPFMHKIFLRLSGKEEPKEEES